jgi:hypothetical protein
MYSSYNSIHSFSNQKSSMFSNITINSITSTSKSITVNYTKPIINGDLLNGYILEVTYNANSLITQDNSSVFILTVSNLKPLTTYTVKLSGLFNNNITNSKYINHSTILDPPTIISIGMITKNSVSINFMDPSGNGNAITYISNIGMLTGNTTPFIISGLTSNTNYNSITVKTSTYYTGTTTIGYSIPTSIPSFTTLAQPSIITSITPTQVTYNSVIYKVYTFKSNSTMQFILATPIPIYIFMVGGGGSIGKFGGAYSAGTIPDIYPGGGGAGGVFQTDINGITLSSSTTFNITIGTGGVNNGVYNKNGQLGTEVNGTNTVFTNSIITYTAGGGGHGGGYQHLPSSGIGGSSGGVASTDNWQISGYGQYPSNVSCITTGSTSNNLHNNGGTAFSGNPRISAGGGGAGGNGKNGGGGAGGNGYGGAGIIPILPFFGSDTYAMGGYGSGGYAVYENTQPPINNINDALNSGNGGTAGMNSTNPYISSSTYKNCGINGICKIAVRASDFV